MGVGVEGHRASRASGLGRAIGRGGVRSEAARRCGLRARWASGCDVPREVDSSVSDPLRSPGDVHDVGRRVRFDRRVGRVDDRLGARLLGSQVGDDLPDGQPVCLVLCGGGPCGELLSRPRTDGPLLRRHAAHEGDGCGVAGVRRRVGGSGYLGHGQPAPVGGLGRPRLGVAAPVVPAGGAEPQGGQCADLVDDAVGGVGVQGHRGSLGKRVCGDGQTAVGNGGARGDADGQVGAGRGGVRRGAGEACVRVGVEALGCPGPRPRRGAVSASGGENDTSG